jgi:outer membrane protein W
MKRTVIVLSAALIFLLPITALGQDMPSYAVIKGGAYFPTGDLDDTEFDTGFNGEVAYGYYFQRNLALEIGVGYFETEASFSSTVAGLPISEKDEIWVIPVTLTAKGVTSAEGFELYVGVGAGAYFVDFEADLTIAAVEDSIDDDDVLIGGILVLGANVDITSNVFVGVEGKYLLTNDAEFEGAVFGVPVMVETDINGFTLTGNLGIRF